MSSLLTPEARGLISVQTLTLMVKDKGMLWCFSLVGLDVLSVGISTSSEENLTIDAPTDLLVVQV